jgi:hypothetical protein
LTVVGVNDDFKDRIGDGLDLASSRDKLIEVVESVLDF